MLHGFAVLPFYHTFLGSRENGKIRYVIATCRWHVEEKGIPAWKNFRERVIESWSMSSWSWFVADTVNSMGKIVRNQQ